MGALTNFLKGGVLLTLQYQVMFVQLEADDCGLAGKKACQIWQVLSNVTDLRQSNHLPSYTAEQKSRIFIMSM